MSRLPPLPERNHPYPHILTDDELREWGESCARMAREDERARCIQACEDERVAAEESGSQEDYVYNNAVDYCIAAIRKDTSWLQQIPDAQKSQKK